MLRFGKAPYLECSSAGDKRLSAFHARPLSLRGMSIEEAYQAKKVFADGTTNLSWREAKGRVPVNIKECHQAYYDWWYEYIMHSPTLQDLIRSASGLSDRFGKKGHVCQAEVLWKIRGKLMEMDGLFRRKL